MADPSLAAQADGARYLTFVAGGRRYALAAGEIAEVVRTPTAARVPLSPRALIGLAVYRGAVLPLISLHRLLGFDETPGSGSLAVVLGGTSPAAFTVDAVEALVSAADARGADAQVLAQSGETISGALRFDAEGAVEILDVRGLLADAFARGKQPKRQISAPIAKRVGASETEDESKAEKLLTFEVAGQDYALALSNVEEILPATKSATPIPRAENLVIGVMPHRRQLLPLFSLRGLLGLPPKELAPGKSLDGREKVVVTAVRNVLVGLVVDRVQEILSAEPGSVEPVPAVLAVRSGAEARLQAIYHGRGGRIIAVLSPERLFGEDAMKRLDSMRPADSAGAPEAPTGELRFVVFHLGGDEFALPVEAVEEVARVPDAITRVPKTPDFLEGVVNLRGEMLPVVDQRRRFDMPRSQSGKERRMIVVRTGGRRAGLIVDGVSEVGRCARDAIDPAPDLTSDLNRLVRGVINLAALGRIVMLLDPGELLTPGERGSLDALAGANVVAE